MLLELERVDAGYGESLICEGVSLAVDAGEVVCLLGRNGVGKTTLLRCLVGILPHRAGRILVAGEDMAPLADHARARRGIGYVPQGRLVFPRLTVAENLRSGTLIGGEQQMLALGRALAGRPRLLLLDEPSEGIQPSIVQEIRGIIRRIAAEKGLAILLVEQNLKFATAAASRGYVIDKGRIVAAGPVEQLVRDAVVAEHLSFVEEPRQPA